MTYFIKSSKLVCSLIIVFAIYGLGSGKLVNFLMDGTQKTGSSKDIHAEFNHQRIQSLQPQRGGRKKWMEFVQMGKLRIPIEYETHTGNLLQARNQAKADMLRLGYRHLADDSTTSEDSSLNGFFGFDVFIGPKHDVSCIVYQPQPKTNNLLVAKTVISKSKVINKGIIHGHLMSGDMTKLRIPDTDLEYWSDMVVGNAFMATGDHPGGNGIVVARQHHTSMPGALGRVKSRLTAQGFNVNEINSFGKDPAMPVLHASNGRTEVNVGLTDNRDGTYQCLYRFQSMN